MRTLVSIAGHPTKPRHLSAVDEHISQTVRSSGQPIAALARHIGMSRASLYDRLQGRTYWSARELPHVARVLGIRVADLVADEAFGEQPANGADR